MTYRANTKRYLNLNYRRCGNSGLLLPPITLGLWHHFSGKQKMSDEAKNMLFRAFDRGITHFDLANNYGPPPGSAEENFGKILNTDFKKYRDELIISTKAGYHMWDGPYGDWSSKKYLISSLDQSLKRMRLDYVDIFYSHRYDPLTPLEETADALSQIVNQGKALYVGISSYSSKQTKKMNKLLKERGISCLIHQPSYSLINRWIEKDLIKTLKDLKIGCIAFSPLAQGMLTNKYLITIPKKTRISENNELARKLKKMRTKSYLMKIKGLDKIAKKRGQSLAQMALSWVLRHPSMTSALIGARNVKQLDECLDSQNNMDFSKHELKEINKHAKEEKINLWAKSSKD